MTYRSHTPKSTSLKATKGNLRYFQMVNLSTYRTVRVKIHKMLQRTGDDNKETTNCRLSSWCNCVKTGSWQCWIWCLYLTQLQLSYRSFDTFQYSVCSMRNTLASVNLALKSPHVHAWNNLLPPQAPFFPGLHCESKEPLHRGSTAISFFFQSSAL